MGGQCARYSSLLGPDIFPDPLSLCKFFFFFFYISLPYFLFHLHFYFHFVSPPSLSFIIFQFLLFFSSSPLFFVSCCFIWVPSLPFLYYADTFPPVCLYLGLVPRDYIHPLNFIVTELFFILISFLPYFFLYPSVHIITFLGLPALHMVILPWSSTGL